MYFTKFTSFTYCIWRHKFLEKNSYSGYLVGRMCSGGREDFGVLSDVAGQRAGVWPRVDAAGAMLRLLEARV